MDGGELSHPSRKKADSHKKSHFGGSRETQLMYVDRLEGFRPD